jgi:hypothetical protein
MQAKEILTTLCGLSGEETSFDFSGQHLYAGDAVLIANDISDMGALTSLNLASNSLGELVLPEGWRFGFKGDGSNEQYLHADGRAQKENPGKPDGIIALVDAIQDMRAISSLNLAKNMIRAEGAKHLSAAIKGHKTLTVLDISSNEIGAYSRDNDGGFSMDCVTRRTSCCC